MFSADENIAQHNAPLEGKARVFLHYFSCDSFKLVKRMNSAMLIPLPASATHYV